MCPYRLVQLACQGLLPGLHLSRQALDKLVQGSAGPMLGSLLERDSTSQPSIHIMADPACAMHCTAERCRLAPKHAGPFTPRQTALWTCGRCADGHVSWEPAGRPPDQQPGAR